MIRINLLPQAKKAATASASTGSAQGWVVVYFVASLVWLVGLVGIYLYHQGILEEQQAANQALQQRIEVLKAKSSQLEAFRAKLKKSEELEALVDDLNRARMGPTRVMMELTSVLSPGPSGGPTIDPKELEKMRRENPLAGFNPNWDPRRLWITNFTEASRECRISGIGKNNEDVAEFLRRLSLSETFGDVTLQKTESTTNDETGLTFISFELTCGVRY